MKMFKARLQGISAGIIFTTCIFAGCYYGTGLLKETNVTIEEAKEMLENDGFVVSLPHEEAKQTVQPSKETDHSPNAEESAIVSYTIKVKSNMTTTEIAKRLFEKKIIDDASEFEAYMNEHGFSKKIQIGEFVVTNTMSYRQLANTLSH
ncbi:endolytic transglycosylase MltG [Peribacillus simplex]|nr:endolytic transglycosylase MltG [Peribacillus simplex]